MVKPKRPLNECSKANWGDHPETQEGRVICVDSTSKLVAIVLKSKDKQWEKIVAAALASGRCKNMKAAAAAAAIAAMDLGFSQAAMVLELQEDDSVLKHNKNIISYL